MSQYIVKYMTHLKILTFLDNSDFLKVIFGQFFGHFFFIFELLFCTKKSKTET